MPIDFKSALGVHPQALVWGARRNRLLVSNLVNAETPNYKARDVDFHTIIKQQQGADFGLQQTHQKHLPLGGDAEYGAELLYRIPHQSSLDGNTVDVQMEQAEIAQNAVRYQATLRFLGGRFNGMIRALKGE